MRRLILSVAVFVILLSVLGGMLSRDEVVIDWWRRGRPPHPYVMPSWIAGMVLDSASADEQFYHTFYYGEECGRLLGLDGSVDRGESISPKLRAHFFDGVGHGYEAPTENIIVTVQDIEDFVPDEYQLAIHDGVLRHYTMESKGEPSLVVPFAQQYMELSGLPDPYNGVRIGLQRARGTRLPAALALAAQYPEAYHPALFEELGWRSSGHRPPRAPDATGPLIDDDAYWAKAYAWVLLHGKNVPEASKCHYLHGAIRGRGLRYPWKDSREWIRIQDEIDGFGPECRNAAYQGIAWTVFIHAAHRPDHVRTMVRSITDKAGRGVVELTYALIQQSLSGPEYEPLAPWHLAEVAALQESEEAAAPSGSDEEVSTDAAP